MKSPVLKIGNWAFTPGLISSLSTLMLLLLFVHLGSWQMKRYSEKQSLEKELADKINLPAVPFTTFSKAPLDEEHMKSLRYSRWEVSGQFINHRHILLDNQLIEGRAGYRVITPFVAEGDPKVLLVDRGWIPLLRDRTLLPTFSAISGPNTLQGIINLPSTGLQLKKIELKGNVWPLRVQAIDFKALSQILGTELYPFVFQLEPGAAIGFHIPPLQNSPFPPVRHLGYAIQWFTLALASFIYYLVINTKRFRDAAW